MSPASNDGALQPDTASADETAERILDVALTLFLEFGYRARRWKRWRDVWESAA